MVSVGKLTTAGTAGVIDSLFTTMGNERTYLWDGYCFMHQNGKDCNNEG